MACSNYVFKYLLVLLFKLSEPYLWYSFHPLRIHKYTNKYTYAYLHCTYTMHNYTYMVDRYIYTRVDINTTYGVHTIHTQLLSLQAFHTMDSLLQYRHTHGYICIYDNTIIIFIHI